MKRRGKVFIDDEFAGIIEQDEGEFIFTYDTLYLKGKTPRAVSLTLPLRKAPYKQKTMFAFFDGLIPEGWLLNIIKTNWKINPKDRMGLLLMSCQDTIGNVSVIEESQHDKN